MSYSFNKVEVLVPIKDLVALKKRFNLTLDQTWEWYLLEKLRLAGAPIKKRFLQPPLIKKGRVYEEELIDKNAIVITWEDDDEQNV